MAPSPYFSIIVPTFNSEKTLKVALESIRTQSFADYEVLIMDGGSSDETENIAMKYSVVNSAFKWQQQADKGIYDAMNKGIRKAGGNYLFFMGSDDAFYDPEVLKDIHGLSLQGSRDVIYGNVYSPRFDGVYDGPFTADKLLRKNICHQAIFFKKEVFNTTGIFNLRFSSQADWEHNIKWLLNDSIQVKYTDRIIAHYADGGFSSMNPDQKFELEKPFILLKYGGNKFSRETLKSLRTVTRQRLRQKKNIGLWFKYFGLLTEILRKDTPA